MTQKLLRRDVPLAAGRKLKFTFTVEYEVDLDENVLDYVIPEDGVGEPTLEGTLDDVEQRLDAGKYGDAERLFKTIRENYPLGLVEHEVALADVYHEGPDAPARFETDWELASRERGDEWTTKEWLDGIPPPSSGASAPGISRTTRFVP